MVFRKKIEKNGTNMKKKKKAICGVTMLEFYSAKRINWVCFTKKCDLLQLEQEFSIFVANRKWSKLSKLSIQHIYSHTVLKTLDSKGFRNHTVLKTLDNKGFRNHTVLKTLHNKGFRNHFKISTYILKPSDERVLRHHNLF